MNVNRVQYFHSLFKRFLHLGKSPLKATSTTGKTVSEEEVKKFGNISSEWWIPSGEFAALRAMNKLRIPLIKDCLTHESETVTDLKLISKPLEGFRILDVGCGGGLLAEPLARLGAQVHGIDPSEDNIIAAQLHAALDAQVTKCTTYECNTVEGLAEREPESFDAIVASEVIEHVADQGVFMEGCCRVIKPGGHFFATTINRTFLSLALAKVAAEYVLRIVPADAHNWCKFVTKDEMMEMLRKNGMTFVNFYGMSYNPLINKWSWTNRTPVNYACHARKPDIL